MVSRAPHWNNAVGAWTWAVRERRPVRLVTVGLASKMAGIAWALMARHDKRRDRGKESLTEIAARTTLARRVFKANMTVRKKPYYFVRTGENSLAGGFDRDGLRD